MNIKYISPIVVIWFATMSGAWAQTTQSKTLANAAAPAVIAVKFYADWCGSCKVITPVFHELQAKFDTQPVLYIVLDHTREFNRQQSKYLATSLGLDKIWAKNGGKTGFILLINGKTQEIITTLTKKHDLKQMGAALQAAVNKITS